MIRDSGFYGEVSLHSTDCATQSPREENPSVSEVEIKDLNLNKLK